MVQAWIVGPVLAGAVAVGSMASASAQSPYDGYHDPGFAPGGPGYYGPAESPYGYGGDRRPRPPMAMPSREWGEQRDTGPGPCRETGDTRSPNRGGMVRHVQAMRAGVPEPYRDLENPFAPTRAAVTEASRLYGEHCASCHGEAGGGDGPAGAGLAPQPPNLRGSVRMPIASDGYLFWTIAEGGESLGTGMRAFKGKLSDEQIWKVILYLRSGLPRIRTAG